MDLPWWELIRGWRWRDRLECHLPAVSSQHALGITSAFYRGNCEHHLIQQVKFMEVGYPSAEVSGLLHCLLFGLSC